MVFVSLVEAFEVPDSSLDEVQDLVLLEEEDNLRKGVKIIDMSGETTLGSSHCVSFLDLVRNFASRFFSLDVSSSFSEELSSNASSWLLEHSRSSTEMLGICF